MRKVLQYLKFIHVQILSLIHKSSQKCSNLMRKHENRLEKEESLAIVGTMWANFRLAFVGRHTNFLLKSITCLPIYSFQAPEKANKGLTSAFRAPLILHHLLWEFLFQSLCKWNFLRSAWDTNYNLSSFKLRSWVAANLPWKLLRVYCFDMNCQCELNLHDSDMCTKTLTTLVFLLNYKRLLLTHLCEVKTVMCRQIDWNPVKNEFVKFFIINQWRRE